MKRVSILPHSVKDTFSKIIDIPIDFIVSLGVHPNLFTVLGFFITCVGAYFYAVESIRLGGLFIILGGLCDTIDGKVARKSGLSSNFGAIFDSTLDRYSEFIMFFGVGVYFINKDDPLTTTITFLALGGSMLVSYVRARAEGLGYDCKVGIMQRAERIVYIALGSLIHEYVLIVVLWVVAILANFTVFQRMNHVRTEEKTEMKNKNLDESLGI